MMSIFEYLPTLFLIFAAWKAYKEPKNIVNKMVVEKVYHKINRGYLDKYLISAKIAEKTAERAFNMASSANLGVIALQKALAVPRLMTKQQGIQNEFAKLQVDKLFTKDGRFDFLKCVATDEELEIIDKIEEEQYKQMNGKHKD